MIFVGDISLPYKNSINIDIPEILKSEYWIGNLEGSLIKDGTGIENAVYNNYEAIYHLKKELNFYAFTLANNHIFDTGSLTETMKGLEELNIKSIGIGENLEQAQKPLLINENNQKVLILNFGWEVIQCKIAEREKEGVNPLRKENVINSLIKAKNKYPKAKIIAIMHWSYELEGEPQPFERELAHKMIDLGVDGIIGAHPHRIGGFEIYKGKPIVYSLGNWMFKQNYFCNKKLSFPDFCNQELALEWDFKLNEIKFHFFEYDRNLSHLKYTHTEDIKSETMDKFTPFKGMNHKEYKKWYKKNHFHRNKGLPIYYFNDSARTVYIKNKINKLRDFAIKILSGI